MSNNESNPQVKLYPLHYSKDWEEYYVLNTFKTEEALRSKYMDMYDKSNSKTDSLSGFISITNHLKKVVDESKSRLSTMLKRIIKNSTLNFDLEQGIIDKLENFICSYDQGSNSIYIELNSDDKEITNFIVHLELFIEFLSIAYKEQYEIKKLPAFKLSSLTDFYFEFDCIPDYEVRRLEGEFNFLISNNLNLKTLYGIIEEKLLGLTLNERPEEISRFFTNPTTEKKAGRKRIIDLSQKNIDKLISEFKESDEFKKLKYWKVSNGPLNGSIVIKEVALYIVDVIDDPLIGEEQLKTIKNRVNSCFLLDDYLPKTIRARYYKERK